MIMNYRGNVAIKQSLQIDVTNGLLKPVLTNKKCNTRNPEITRYSNVPEELRVQYRRQLGSSYTVESCCFKSIFSWELVENYHSDILQTKLSQQIKLIQTSTGIAKNG